jgi:sarcosine oxidase subunit beta
MYTAGTTTDVQANGPARMTIDAAIVGCGIAGASTAFFLASHGFNVSIFERDRPASGGTGRSAAIVRQHYSTTLMARLAHRSVQIFKGARELLGKDAGYQRAGYVFLSPAEAVETTRRNVAMQQALGIDTRMLNTNEMAVAFPWLNPDSVAGIAFEPDGGYADPETATQAFLDAAVAAGARLHVRAPVRALSRRDGGIAGVVTEDGEIACGLVVNAAGPWAAPLAASAGIELSMRTVREQDTVWQARRNRPLPTCSVSNAVDAIYVRPLGQERFIVGRGFPKPYIDVDPYNYRLAADDDFVADVERRLTLRLPGFEGAQLIHAYAALYDVTKDWYQYVGPREALSGYADFCGGSGHGFKVAPAIAEELARWLATGQVADDFRQLSYDRIGRNELFVQGYGGNRG